MKRVRLTFCENTAIISEIVFDVVPHIGEHVMLWDVSEKTMWEFEVTGVLYNYSPNKEIRSIMDEYIAEVFIDVKRRTE